MLASDLYQFVGSESTIHHCTHVPIYIQKQQQQQHTQAKNQMACLPSAALHTELLPLILSLSLQPQHLDQSVLPAKDSARRLGLVHHNCVMSTRTDGGRTHSEERQSMSTAGSATASDKSEFAKQDMQAA